MKTIRATTVAALVLSLATLTLVGARATVSAQAVHAGTIKIGAFAPESGQYASAGIDIINGFKLAVANMNKAGGVMGRQIMLDVQDSPCNPQVAVQAAQKLVTDGVVAVVGPYCSSDAIPASTIFHRAGIAMVTPASTNPALTASGFDDILRTCGRDDQQGAFAARLMAGTLHATRIAIIHDNSTYGKGLAVQTQMALKDYPKAKVVFFDAITPGSNDFTSTLTKIRTLKPQATYFTGYYSDGALLLKQFKQLGVSGRFIGGDANDDATFIKLAGSYAEGTLFTTEPTPELVPTARAFVRQFTSTYHVAPGPFSGYGYDAVDVVLHAIKTAGSSSPSAIVQALHKTKDFPGVTGPITFNRQGDRVQIQYTVVTVKNGKFALAHL